HVVLEEYERPLTGETGLPEQPLSEGLFVVTGESLADLGRELEALRAHAEGRSTSAHALARSWWRNHGGRRGRRTVGLVAADTGEIARLAEAARTAVLSDPGLALPGQHAVLRDRVFFSPEPLGEGGQLAFVYPGSGNEYPGMGRDLALAWPGV